MEQSNCPRIHAMQYCTAIVNIYEVSDDLENHLYYNVTWKKQKERSTFTVWSQPYLKSKQEKRLEGNKIQKVEPQDGELVSVLSLQQ